MAAHGPTLLEELFDWSGAQAGGWPNDLAVGRQPPGQQVEDEDDRAGDQQQRNQRHSDDQDVDPGIIGDPGGDSHDPGVAPVDQETVRQFGLRFKQSSRLRC